MSSKPDKEWASGNDARPHSRDIEDKNIITSAPYFSDWQQSFDGEVEVKIHPAHWNIVNELDSIFYTIDGTTPTRFSTLYDKPFTVSSDATVKAVTYNPESGYSAIVTRKMTRTLNDRKLTYITKPAPQYSENGEKGLIDRLHGTENYRIGGWQGWQGNCEVVVDLLEPRTVSIVATECLENMKSWVFFPTRVEVEVSDDGTNYRPFGSVDNRDFPATLERQELSVVHNFIVNGTPTLARYVRIKALNSGKLPKWHISAGEQAWLFVDEIEVH